MAKNKKNTAPAQPSNDLLMVGENLGFDGVEAFNLLRTNLAFSFSGSKSCRLIGVTSAIPGTGKSLIAANLAYSISKMDKRVLLLDTDMRLPTVAKKLALSPKPGLSNVLVGRCKVDDAIQHFAENMDVMPAGDIPPQPSELLGSASMEALIATLTQRYDYIIFDTTPITVVPDVLVLASYLDGFVLVVRREHDEKHAVRETLRQMELSKAKILGLVFNSGEHGTAKYGKSYKKGKGSGRYYGGDKA